MNVEQSLARVKAGLGTLNVPESQEKEALRQFAYWLREDAFSDYHAQMNWMVEAEAWSLLFDSFYRVIPFGTGGRRGAVGIGPNRINPYTISTSVQGHIAFLRSLFPSIAQHRVVIAYDVREFRDLKQRYSATHPNPLLGLRSKDLCHLAARIYAANGVTAYILPLDDETYISTPELSFLIRAYEAQGGLNVSASHNHPDDNGGKFYNDEGGQPVPPTDQDMLSLVAEVKEVAMLSMDEAIASGHIQWIEPSVRDRYVSLNAALVGTEKGEPIKVVYSPMHGTGTSSVGRACEEAGFPLVLFPSQAEPDGCFPNVRFQMPNPEVREAMQDVIDWANTQDAELVLATDPDADRLGLAAVDAKGEWRFFTGNEIAVLLAEHCLQRWAAEDRPRPPIVVKTEVTTGLVERVTHAHDGVCVGGLLVGFKYIGKALGCWEKGESFLGTEGAVERYVLGTEESHGYLVSPEVRDKDAAGAAVLLVEFASLCKARGTTLCEVLDGLYRTHGYHCNRLVSVVMEGAAGVQNIANMQAALRKEPPAVIAGLPVVASFDHRDESGRFGPIQSETDCSGRNVLVFHVEGGSRLILRPSGTEPKVKLYVEVVRPSCDTQEQLNQEMERAVAQASEMAESFMLSALSKIGIDMPTFAMRTSDLLSIDARLAFANDFIPAWRARIEGLVLPLNEEQRKVEAAFVIEQTKGFGKEPHAMCSGGVDAYLEEQRAAGVVEELVAVMAAIWEAAA